MIFLFFFKWHCFILPWCSDHLLCIAEASFCLLMLHSASPVIWLHGCRGKLWKVQTPQNVNSGQPYINISCLTFVRIQVASKWESLGCRGVFELEGSEVKICFKSPPAGRSCSPNTQRHWVRSRLFNKARSTLHMLPIQDPFGGVGERTMFSHGASECSLKWP